MKRWLALFLLLAPMAALADPATFTSWFLTIGLNTGSAALISAATALGYIASAITFISIGNYQRRKAAAAARDAQNALLKDRLVMTATADAARSRIYGRCRNVDGVLFHESYGPDKEYYRLIVALCGHESQSIDEIWFGDTQVTLDSEGWVNGGLDMDGNAVDVPYVRADNGSPIVVTLTVDGGTQSVELSGTPVGEISVIFDPSPGDSWSGDVQQLGYSIDGTTLTFTALGYGQVSIVYHTGATSSYVRIVKYLGTATQNVATGVGGHVSAPGLAETFPDIINTDDNDDRFAGVTLLDVTLRYSYDAFPSGLPSITGVVKGVKANGTWNADRTLETGGTWTENPAKIIEDWSLYANGGGMSSDHLHTGRFTTEKSLLDASYSDFVSPDGTQNLPTFTCNIVCKLDQPPEKSLDEMVESMAGKRGWTGGKLSIKSGIYQQPTGFTIDEDWITDKGSITVLRDVPRSELVNVYKVSISDKARGYAALQAPPIEAAQYITDDMARYEREITAEAITDIYHAQHVVGVMLRDARQMVIELPCNMKAWPLELFDSCHVVLPFFGWNADDSPVEAKEFEVIGWNFTIEGGVVLRLKETAEWIFDIDAGFSDLYYEDNTDLPKPWQVDAVTGLAVDGDIELSSDGAIVNVARVTWDEHTQRAVTESGRIELQYQKLGTYTTEVGWVNNSGVPVSWVNESGALIEWSTSYGVSETGWASELYMGNQIGANIVGLPDPSVYAFRVRAINTVGVRSAWSDTVIAILLGKAEPPPPIEDFGAQEGPAGLVQWWWTYTDPPVDLSGFEARYSPYAYGQIPFLSMMPLFAKDRWARQHDGIALPDGSYMVAMCAVDTTGHYSAPLYKQVDFEQGLLGTPRWIVRPGSERWPGTLSGCFIELYYLMSLSDLTWDDTTTWNAFTSWNDGNLTSPITYTHTTIDLGAVYTVKMRGSGIANGTLAFEVNYSEDNVFWTGWGAPPSGAVDARYIQSRWSVTGSMPILYSATLTVYDA